MPRLGCRAAGEERCRGRASCPALATLSISCWNSLTMAAMSMLPTADDGWEGLQNRVVGLGEPSCLGCCLLPEGVWELYKFPVRRPPRGGRRTSLLSDCTEVCFPVGRTPCGGLLGRPPAPQAAGLLRSPETSRRLLGMYVE
jgi:hypothetical protein